MGHSSLARAPENDRSRLDMDRVRKQFEDLQRQVADLCEIIAPEPPSQVHAGFTTPDKVSHAAIRRIIKSRRTREQIFGRDLFSDPAWDMLLELYGRHHAQQRITISELCTASATPGTTALRWIKTLEAEGLVERRNDPLDGRRVFVALSQRGLNAMSAYFAVPEHLGSI